jgi:hypothetical protein
MASSSKENKNELLQLHVREEFRRSSTPGSTFKEKLLSNILPRINQEPCGNKVDVNDISVTSPVAQNHITRMSSDKPVTRRSSTASSSSTTPVQASRDYIDYTRLAAVELYTVIESEGTSIVIDH